jgi:hypothetical protein
VFDLLFFVLSDHSHKILLLDVMHGRV